MLMKELLDVEEAVPLMLQQERQLLNPENSEEMVLLSVADKPGSQQSYASKGKGRGGGRNDGRKQEQANINNIITDEVENDEISNTISLHEEDGESANAVFTQE
ncbi:hypothetical protein PIB30_057615 [Stylosanthes scabra]|uniref:Uncharacterized protein n=1 Tax=Stylosanthes scabra TaxID=79078 RepID=A0ABU6RKH0_9FABA|nr:hypothetical protein [Stylosanthes scabra]